MYIWPKEIQQIIAEVLHAQNPITCLEKFKNYEPAKKITFLLFDGNQTTNFQYITHDYNLSKYRIVNLGNYANTAIITTSMLLDKNDLTAIKTAYSVNIDSNIVSMLPQLLKNKPITPDFLNFLVYIKKNNLDLNISPYLLEDSLNSSGMKNEARAYECLLSFFSFSDLSLQQLYSLPISPDVIAFNHADDAWSQMKYSRFYERNDEKRVRSIYCFLLKVYIIEFGSKKSSRKKLIELVDFINTNLGIYLESGLLLAYWYFNKSYNCVLDFFQKIQPGAKDKLKKVKTVPAKKQKTKRPPVNFFKCNIPVGAELVFSDDPSVVAVVVDERKVQYKDEITSLSAISDRIKGYSTSGPSLFTYKGKTISQIAEETQWKDA